MGAAFSTAATPQLLTPLFQPTTFPEDQASPFSDRVLTWGVMPRAEGFGIQAPSNCRAAQLWGTLQQAGWAADLIICPVAAARAVPFTAAASAASLIRPS